MSDNSRASQYVPLWGIILLFLGVVFLLQTLNIIPWGIWGAIWRFWPVLLIIGGLIILLRPLSPGLTILLILILLFGTLGAAIWRYAPPSAGGQSTRNYSEPLGNLEKAQVRINTAAGTLVIGSLPAASANFVEGLSKTRDGVADIRVDFQRQDSTGKLNLSTERVNQQLTAESNWEVNFSRKIPLTIEIDSAVGNLNLDFSDLQLTELLMDVDAGNYVVKMPASAGDTRAKIKANVANLQLTIPSGVALNLKADVNLSAFDIDQNRFPGAGRYYASPDFDTAKNRIRLELDGNLGRVEIR